MVFLTDVNLRRHPFLKTSKSPDSFWKKRKLFKFAAHFPFRARNCYTLTLRAVLKSMELTTKHRKVKKWDMKELWETRIAAGTEEHGMPLGMFRASLERCNILLNRRVLSDLAIWEPRTFKALTDIAKKKAIDEKLPGYEKLENPSHVITRGLLNYKK